MDTAFWGPIISAAITAVAQGGLGGVVADQKGRSDEKIADKNNEAELERQRLADAAALERTLASLGMQGKTTAASVTGGLAQQALSNIPDAYKTLVNAILTGGQMEQAGMKSLAQSGQAAMPRR